MTNNAKNILLIGPAKTPVTGQSYAFAGLDSLAVLSEKIEYNRGILGLFPFYRKLFVKLFKPYDVLYVSISRSNMAFFSRDIFIIMFGILKGIKIICHIHGSDFSNFICKNYIAKFLYKWIDAFCVLSESMKDQVKDFNKVPIFVIENFHDFSNLTVAKKNEKFVSISYFSNLMTDKGIINFLKLVKQLGNNSHYRFAVAGGIFSSDPNINEIKSLLADCLKISNFRYHGLLTDEKKLRFLLESDVLVLQSSYKSEAQPISLIEGLACGNYIISSEVGYIPDLLENYNCKIIDSTSFISLLDAIEGLREIPNLQQLQIENHKRAYPYFCLNTHLKKIETMIDKVAATKEVKLK